MTKRAGKYGTLKYVSESGRYFKTNKGQVLKFVESKKKKKMNEVSGWDLEDEDLTLVRWERTSRVYQRFDAILTGFAVMVDLRETEGVTDCPIMPYDFNNDFNNDFLIAI